MNHAYFVVLYGFYIEVTSVINIYFAAPFMQCKKQLTSYVTCRLFTANVYRLYPKKHGD